MKVKLAKLLSPTTNTNLYMYPDTYERYKKYDIFRDTFQGYVTFDKIYINVFDGIMFDINEIKRYNEDAIQIKEEEA